MIKILLVMIFCFYTLAQAEETAAGPQGAAGGPPQPETTPTPTAEPIYIGTAKKFDINDKVNILNDIDGAYRRTMSLENGGKTEAGLSPRVKGTCPNCVLSPTNLGENSNPPPNEKGTELPPSTSGSTDGGRTPKK